MSHLFPLELILFTVISIILTRLLLSTITKTRAVHCTVAPVITVYWNEYHIDDPALLNYANEDALCYVASVSSFEWLCAVRTNDKKLFYVERWKNRIATVAVMGVVAGFTLAFFIIK